MRICIVNGCGKEVRHGRVGGMWARLCPQHRSRRRRHGDPEQRSITARILSTALRDVQDHVIRAPNSPAWPALREAVEVLQQRAEAALAPYRAGQAMRRSERLAWEELLKVSKDAKPDAVWQAVASVVLHQQRFAEDFASDAAFSVQVARTFRRLSETHVAESWDHKAQRFRRHYRDMSVSAASSLGGILVVALGAPGLYFARMERKADERQREAHRRIMGALEEMASAEPVA